MRRALAVLLLAFASACGTGGSGGDAAAPAAAGPVCPLPDFGTEGTYERLTVVYDSPEGFDLLADVYTPEGDGPFPGLMVLHGGGWVQDDRSTMRRTSEHYAAHGMTVFNIEYRLAPFTKARGIGRDLSCASRWFRAHAEAFKADPDCLGALGESAGAHLADMAALAWDEAIFQGGCEGAGETEAAFRFVVSYFGPASFEDMFAFNPLYRLFVPIFLEEGDDLDVFDAIRYADRHPEVAFYLPHGTADELVPDVISDRFAAALRAAGHVAVVRKVEGAPHGFIAHDGFDKPVNQSIQPEVEAFIREALGAGH
ncbi:MAG: alpha/beta hydrolase [Candidatus Methylomirabilis sp.]|nr:alpha/beta hydrolase [Deltaproteobacteria bacterium]